MSERRHDRDSKDERRPSHKSRSPRRRVSRSHSRERHDRHARSDGDRHGSRAEGRPDHSQRRDESPAAPSRRGQRHSRSPAAASHRRRSRSPAVARNPSPPRRAHSPPRRMPSPPPQQHLQQHQHQQGGDRGSRWGASTEQQQHQQQQYQQHQPFQPFQQQQHQQQPFQPRPPQAPVSDAPPPLGSIHHGKVHTIRPFGLFVSLPGFRRHVLVHHSQASEDIVLEREDEDAMKVKAMAFYFAVGSPVWVKVIEVSPDERTGDMRLHGSFKAVSQEDGKDLDPTNAMAAPPGRGGGGGGAAARGTEAPPEVGSIHHATVKRIEAYGVFVQMPGFNKHGLVPSAQVSNYLTFSKEDTDEEKKAGMSGVVVSGDMVWVKVVEVTEDPGGRGPKIACSIKLVSQSDGGDLDPENSRYKPRGGGGDMNGMQQPIGAAAAGVSSGRVDWGYLQADNKQHVGEYGKYDMLEDDGKDRLPGPSTSGQVPLPPPPSLPPPPPLPSRISSVEEALAVIGKFAAGAKKKSKKKDKDKDKKKKKKSSKSKKEKSSKARRKAASPSSSGSDDSDRGPGA